LSEPADRSATAPSIGKSHRTFAIKNPPAERALILPGRRDASAVACSHTIGERSIRRTILREAKSVRVRVMKKDRRCHPVVARV
jgi:hypothetical protein